MLLQFAVENHKSIRDRVVLSMLAADHVEHPPGHVYDVPGVGKVLKVVALYGANASGKSNVLDAWTTFARLVSEGVRSGHKPKLTPFKLDPHFGQRPTSFEAMFWIADRVWRYQLQLGSQGVLSESLDIGEDSLFSRDEQGIEWGPEIPANRREFLGFVGEGTRPEQPVLAELKDRNGFEVLGLVLFLEVASLRSERDGLRNRVGGLSSGPTNLQIYSESSELVLDLGQWLRDAGTGVGSVRLAAPNPERSDRLEFLHHGQVLDFSELSTGSRELVVLFPDWIRTLSAGVLMTIDEFGRSYHTALTRFLLERAFEQCQNGGQLLFTTHDTNLLDAELLGADGIWFVEKDSDGATRLYSLAEFDPDELAQLTGHLEQGYLNGRFGGIPFLGDPHRLKWLASE